MFLFSKRRAIAWLAFIAIAIFETAPALAALTQLHKFLSPTGLDPYAKLTVGPNGNLYGTAQSGGPGGKGTVFKITPDGAITRLVSFDGSNGSQPNAELVLGSDGNFYGTTAGNNGSPPTVFKMSVAGSLTTLATLASNVIPIGPVVLASDGNVYGTTGYFPSGALGSIYKVAPDGQVSILVTFPSDGSMGTAPHNLLQGADGNLYGVTTGTGGMQNPGGVIFKAARDGSSLSSLFAFTTPSGPGLNEAIVQDVDGSFLALALNGPQWTIYRVTSDGTGAALSSFNRGIHGGLSRTRDGRYCGTSSGAPIVFCFTGSGQYSEIAQIPTHDLLQGVVQGLDGNFYVSTMGSGGQSSFGDVYKVTQDGVVTKFASLGYLDGADPTGPLIEASDGNFYGTTVAGGDQNKGTVFRITPTGEFTKLASFDGINGDSPVAGLTQAPDGNLYGFTVLGGDHGVGTLFKITYDGTLTAVASFQGLNIFSQDDPLTVGPDGLLYGTSCNGGANNYGTIFRLSANATLTSLFSFSGPDGNCPNGLVLGPDGLLYGTTASGGPNGVGSFFSFTTDSRLTSLNSSGLTNPNWTVAFAGDGTVYGPTSAAGLGLFRRTQSGTFTPLQTAGGQFWSRGITLASNGRLYGSSTAGTIYQVTPAGTYDAVISTSSNKVSLAQASDGNFYGSASASGSDRGSIFRLDGPPPAPTNLAISPGSNYSQLTWNAVAGATSYNVYASTSPSDPPSTRIQTGVTNTVYSATSLNSGVSYYFAVRAVRDGVESLPSNEVTMTTPAPTVTLSVNPNAIAQGSSATLTWNSTNATACTASGGWSGSETTSGSLVVTPSAGTHTYTLSCNGGGPSATASTTLAVSPGPSVSFSINPGFITLGDSATFAWSSTAATSCVGTGAWSGNLPLSATQLVTPTTQGFLTYGITCTGSGGSSSASASIKVFPAPLPTISISVNPTAITLGDSATVTWNTTNATSCTASEAWAGDRPVSGQEVLTSSQAGGNRYTLGCSGRGGFVAASAILNALPAVSFTTSAVTAAESAGSVGVFVQLSGATDGDVTIPLTYSGSATGGTDYTGTVSSVTVPKGSTSASIVISIADDAHYEPTETIVITASAPYNATLRSPSTEAISILDNDLHVSLSPTSASAFVLEQQCVIGLAYETAGSALSGIALAFNRSGTNPGSGSATSGSDGTAQHCWTGNHAGADSITVQSAYASAHSTINWNPRPLSFRTKGFISAAPLAEQVTINPQATVLDARAGGPVVGKTIHFMANKQFLCDGVTGSDGLAKCNATIVGRLQGAIVDGFTAIFDGDDIYAAGRAQGSLACIGANCAVGL